MNFTNIKRIAKHEIRRAFRTKAVFLSALILGAALLAALVVAWQNARTLTREREKYQEIVRSNWVAQPDRHPHRVAHYGYLAFRPKATLSFFDAGLDSFTGTSVFLEAHRQNTVNFSEARHSNGLLRFGELNPALILQTIVPLLIFFLGFASIAGEREDGTLALLLAQGVRWREVLIGKTIGILAVIFILLAPLLVASFALWFALNDFSLASDAAARIALLLAGYAVYFIVCASIAVVVSALSRSSRGALAALIVVWVCFWIVVPRGAQNAGARLFPTPSKPEFNKLLEEDLAKEGDSHNPDDPKFAALKREVLAKYAVTDVRDLPFNYGGFVMAKSEEIGSEIFRRHYAELLEKFRRQNRVGEIAGVFDPFLAVRHFSQGVAGTDFAAYENFALQTEDFRYRMVQRLNEFHANEIKAENDRTQKINRARWQEFTDFRYREPSLRETLSAQSLSIFSLLFWLVAAAVALRLTPNR